MLLNTVSNSYGQNSSETISGTGATISRDLGVMNMNDYEKDAAIRFLTKSSSEDYEVYNNWTISNLLNEGGLNFSHYQTYDGLTIPITSPLDDSNAGDLSMKIQEDGTLNIKKNLTVGDTLENLVVGSSLTVAGNMYIAAGTQHPAYTDINSLYGLIVEKGMVSDSFYVTSTTNWADFVFDKAYTLPSLASVENFIIKNGHLPDVPSETAIKEKGYDLHEMNVIFLQKIEELTLYTIQQRKLLEKMLAITDRKKL